MKHNYYINNNIDNYLKILELINDDDNNWDFVLKNDQIKILKQQKNDSPSVIVKAQAYLKNIDYETVFENIYDINKRMKWDELCCNFKIIEEGEDRSCFYYSLKNQFSAFVTTRDFC